MWRFFFLMAMFCFFSVSIWGANYYWVGGTGNWNDLNHWATTSGGTVKHTQIPTALDNVIFDAASFTAPNQTVTVNINVICNDMDWNGVTNQPTFDGAALYEIRIYGSLRLVTAMNFNFQGQARFEATTPGKTIACARQRFKNDIIFEGVGGSWSLGFINSFWYWYNHSF